MKVFQETRCAH